jgi:hypothetical protein
MKSPGRSGLSSGPPRNGAAGAVKGKLPPGALPPSAAKKFEDGRSFINLSVVD